MPSLGPPIIFDKHDLIRYGFDAARFRKVARYEWHGPCPVCGGRDRMRVWADGYYSCRMCTNYGRVGQETRARDPAELAALARQQQQAAEQERAARQRKIRQLTRTQIHQEYHRNLLAKPDLLAWLATERGISLSGVKQFLLGYCPAFPVMDWEQNRYVEVPTLTYPIIWGSWVVNIRHKLLTPVGRTRYLPHTSGLGNSFLVADFPDQPWVVLAEGENKAIVLHLNGIPALGLLGANNFEADWVPWLRRRYRLIYLALDPDPGGQLGVRLIQAVLPEAIALWLPDKADDLFVQHGWTTADFVQQIINNGRNP